MLNTYLIFIHSQNSFSRSVSGSKYIEHTYAHKAPNTHNKHLKSFSRVCFKRNIMKCLKDVRDPCEGDGWLKTKNVKPNTLYISFTLSKRKIHTSQTYIQSTPTENKVHTRFTIDRHISISDKTAEFGMVLQYFQHY